MHFLQIHIFVTCIIKLWGIPTFTLVVLHIEIYIQFKQTCNNSRPNTQQHKLLPDFFNYPAPMKLKVVITPKMIMYFMRTMILGDWMYHMVLLCCIGIETIKILQKGETDLCTFLVVQWMQKIIKGSLMYYMSSGNRELMTNFHVTSKQAFLNEWANALLL